MRVPISWLSEFVDLKGDPYKIADLLTLAGHEVEEIIDPYERLGELITVKILEVINPEDLQETCLCRVTDGKNVFEVLTTAKHIVKPGLIVALAKAGSLTFTHQKVEIKTIRGYRSEGMFLSPFEAGLSEERDTLLTFAEGTKLGESIYKVLGVSEPVLEIAITPNRGDLLSVYGIGRELSLITGWELKPLVFEESLKEGISFPGKIKILDEDGCFRYVGRYGKGVRVGESPFFILKRLFLCNQRPINNLVDITNYVLLELGQPLHAFDWRKIKGGEILIRRAKPNETLLMLDGVERRFTEEDLVIADREKALVLAGVMGGEESGVSSETEEIFLEAAWFNPKRIRLTGQRHRLTTESSYRFERGVDPEGVYLGILRATELIKKILNPEAFSEIVDLYPRPFEAPTIELSRKKLIKVLGFEIESEKVESLLSKLGEFQVSGEIYKVKPFSYRQDLTIPEDLVEEVARLYGYDKIPVTMPEAELSAKGLSRELQLVNQIKDILRGLGFYEVITYSFINPESLKKLNLPLGDRRLNFLKLANPISPALSVMRTTLLPGLLEVARFNAHREVEDLRIFEVGKVFYPASELSEERETLGLLLKGNQGKPFWGQTSQNLDVFDLKGILEELFSLLRIPLLLVPFSVEPFLKRGISFDIYLEDKKVGFAGEIKRVILEEFDLRGPLFVAEIDLVSLINYQKKAERSLFIRKPPKYPSTFRDIACILDKKIPYREIMDFMKNLEVPYLERVELVALYIGDPIPPGKKSISLRFWYRSEERTLKDEEVEEIHRKVAKKLFEHFGAKPR